MSNINLPALIDEISHEISRDSKGWYFTQRAASRIAGMTRSAIGEGLAQADGPLAAFAPAGKLLRSIAAQGISLAGWGCGLMRDQQGRSLGMTKVWGGGSGVTSRWPV